jgi:hypothetical protein
MSRDLAFPQPPASVAPTAGRATIFGPLRNGETGCPVCRDRTRFLEPQDLANLSSPWRPMGACGKILESFAKNRPSASNSTTFAAFRRFRKGSRTLREKLPKCFELHNISENLEELPRFFHAQARHSTRKRETSPKIACHRHPTFPTAVGNPGTPRAVRAGGDRAPAQPRRRA